MKIFRRAKWAVFSIVFLHAGLSMASGTFRNTLEPLWDDGWRFEDVFHSSFSSAAELEQVNFFTAEVFILPPPSVNPQGFTLHLVDRIDNERVEVMAYRHDGRFLKSFSFWLNPKTSRLQNRNRLLSEIRHFVSDGML